MRKSKIYPNYTNLYYLNKNDTITLKRDCTDGIIRFIKTIEFESPEDCKKYWDNKCGG